VEFATFIAATLLALFAYLKDTQNLAAFWTIISVILLGVGIARRAKEGHDRTKRIEVANKLAAFIEHRNKLLERSAESPLPIKEHNDWVDEIERYLIGADKRYWVTKLNDFSGYTFYSDGSPKSEYENSISGRKRRLHEFINALGI